MAVRHQDGLLLGRLVAEPAVLLLGDRGRRRGHLRGLAPVEQCYARAVGYIRALRCTSHLTGRL